MAQPFDSSLSSQDQTVSLTVIQSLTYFVSQSLTYSVTKPFSQSVTHTLIHSPNVTDFWLLAVLTGPDSVSDSHSVTLTLSVSL